MANPNVNAPSALPVRKVTASVLAGAVVTVAVFVAQQYFNLAVSSDLSAAAVVVVSFVIAYLVPSSAGEAPAKGASQ